MTSHVEEQVQARIAAARAKTQQQREDREAFAERRAAGIKARKHQKLRRIFCGTCAKLQRRGSYLRCPFGCGAALCRARAGCGNTHLRQCPNRCSAGNDSANRGGTATVRDLRGAAGHAGGGPS